MITSLRLVDFKNFADENLRVGPFTVIVGTNASGKSNIRDAFRILYGIGRGYTLAEIISGKRGAGNQVEWAPIRGAANEVIRFGQPGFCLQVELKLGRSKVVYSIRVERDEDIQAGFRVTKEQLRFGGWGGHIFEPSVCALSRSCPKRSYAPSSSHGENRTTKKVRLSDRYQTGSTGADANQGAQERCPNT